MKQGPRSTTRARSDVWDRVAAKVREVVRHEHVNTLSGVERCTVRSLSPLMIEAMDSDLILTDGDPDFTIGAQLRAYMVTHPLQLGDLVWVARENQLWHLFDVSS